MTNFLTTKEEYETGESWSVTNLPQPLVGVKTLNLLNWFE